MQRRAAEESLTDHGKDNSNGRAHVGDAIRHKPGILGFLRQIGFMGAGRVAPPLRRRQRDHAVAVHGEHGDAGHHVLEAAVGLEPSDAPAELPRQCGAVGLRIGIDQGAQQRQAASVARPNHHARAANAMR